MRLRRSEAALVVAAGAAVVAAVVAVAGSTRWAVAVASLALALGLLGLARVGQLVLRELSALGAQQQRTTRTVRRLDEARKRTGPLIRRASRSSGRAARDAAALGKRLTAVEESLLHETRELRVVAGQNLARVDDVLRGARVDSHRFRTSLDTLPSDTLRLMRTTERLMPGTADFPGLGDWAITTSSLLAMLSDVATRTGPVTVVECGSGTSTLFLGLALQQRGDGSRVVALESDAAFAEETRGHLARAGVAEIATVVHAPLVEREHTPGDHRLWFDTSGLPDLDGIDLLFVDGPVGGSTHEARYPAYPFFADLLRDGATVVLDDTDRPDERSIVEKWASAEHAGRQATVHRRNVRSTMLRVRVVDEAGSADD
ncbi:MAG TPA: class I SAM-dependent methyltransferase [Nocardioides sp.]|uniref:O-methyltransferase n=1 Tax=Nocardioides sp. TaxID=35761 RepID=UPI002C283A19|nr:class I SAM-dependent methyltransferase [Nocardioides sp.]HTW17954.1 class I SAM-dependent methyltransferase [Nocardioides sp.]